MAKNTTTTNTIVKEDSIEFKYKKRMCDLILYEEHYPTIEEIDRLCSSRKTFKKYAIIKHDKDIKEEDMSTGMMIPAKNHYHVIINFEVSFDTRALLRLFVHATYQNI